MYLTSCGFFWLTFIIAQLIDTQTKHNSFLSRCIYKNGPMVALLTHSSPLLYNAFFLAFRMSVITIALYFRISVTVEL